MPKYKIIFDTTKGELVHSVTIEDAEIIGEVLPGIIGELKESDGAFLRGDGPAQMVCGSRALTPSKTLPAENVMPGETLLVTCIATNG
jgi:hypothetical protein